MIDSPDEEGIKTRIEPRVREPCVCLIDSPDEEGIKTARPAALSKAGIRLIDSPDEEGIKTDDCDMVYALQRRLG